MRTEPNGKDPEPNGKDRLNYDVRELGKRLGLSKNSIYSAIRRGEVPHIRLNGRIILPKPAIDEWLRTAGKAS